MKLEIRPITMKQARGFIEQHHRHHRQLPGGLWAIALLRAEELVGVAIAGRPVSSVLQRAGCCEITRVCVVEGVEGGCSMLYRRCHRIAQLMGYRRLVSYTVPGESGASLRAAGWFPAAETRGGHWTRPSRPRKSARQEPKIRWETA